MRLASASGLDDCELHPDRARRANVDATAAVVDAASLVGAHVVVVSTDYVFDGTSPDPYTEADPPSRRVRTNGGRRTAIHAAATIRRMSLLMNRRAPKSQASGGMKRLKKPNEARRDT